LKAAKAENQAKTNYLELFKTLPDALLSAGFLHLVRSKNQSYPHNKALLTIKAVG
jgi:hypothetical protein